MKLSIIVPIYNVAPYLRKCVDSLLKQDISDYEIILVDDGSTDYSGVIADEISNAFRLSPLASRLTLRVIHQPNAGLSAARNTGIAAAQGEYIMFVDSDDYLEPNVLGALMEQVRREQLDVLRNIMRNFFSPLKYSEAKLRFLFLTGITKFSQVSIFSELNNITNVSMDDEYAGICGITKEELLENMSDDIDMLADALGYSREMMIAKLKENYDGYHFSKKSPDVFNPYSLLNCFSKKELGAFWFSSGTPTYLINMLRQFGVLPTEIAPTEAVSSSFNAPTENMKTITPLLYQSGYVTIKEYDPETRIYTLDIPNKEIKVGLFDNLLPNYVDGVSAERGNVAIAKMALLIGKRNMDGALHLLQDFLGTVPYCNVTNYEGHYQQMLFIIFTLLTNYLVDVEVHTPRGRVDIVLLTKTDLYVVELKLNKSAQAAMQQINLKNYRQRFALCGLPITKVGINFDSTQGTIEDWVIEA